MASALVTPASPDRISVYSWISMVMRSRKCGSSTLWKGWQEKTGPQPVQEQHLIPMVLQTPERHAVVASGSLSVTDADWAHLLAAIF